MRWSLLTAVICVLLLGAVIVMLNLRASNETETVVLSLQADVSALQEAHTDTIAMLKKEAAAMEERITLLENKAEIQRKVIAMDREVLEQVTALWGKVAELEKKVPAQQDEVPAPEEEEVPATEEEIEALHGRGSSSTIGESASIMHFREESSSTQRESSSIQGESA